MTSQLCHYFQASQAMYGADDIKTPHFSINSERKQTSFSALLFKILYTGYPSVIEIHGTNHGLLCFSHLKTHRF